MPSALCGGSQTRNKSVFAIFCWALVMLARSPERLSAPLATRLLWQPVDVVHALWWAARHYVVGPMVAQFMLQVMIFATSPVGMIAVITRAGGTQGLLTVVRRLQGRPHLARLSVWLVGLILFFAVLLPGHPRLRLGRHPDPHRPTTGLCPRRARQPGAAVPGGGRCAGQRHLRRPLLPHLRRPLLPHLRRPLLPHLRLGHGSAVATLMGVLWVLGKNPDTAKVPQR